MNTSLRRVGSLVERRPALALLALVVLTVLFAGLASQSSTDTDMTAFAPESELTDASERITEEFGTSGTQQQVVQLIVDAGEGGDVLTRDGLQTAEQVRNIVESTPQTAAILAPSEPGSPAVISYALPFQGAAAPAGGLDQLDGPSFDRLAASVLSDAEGGPRAAGLLSSDLDVQNATARAGLVIMPIAEGLSPATQREGELALRDALEAADFDGVNVTPFSAAIFADELLADAEEEMSRLLLLAFALILTILLVTFRRVGDVLLGLGGLVTTIVWTFGIAALLGPRFLGLTGEMNQISLMIPVLLIGLAIDYAIHLTARYREEAAAGATPARAANAAVFSVGGALVLATITTMLGFLTNLLSPLPPMRDFGIFVAAGVLSAFVVMVLLIPSTRSLLDRRRAARGRFTPPPTGSGTRLGRVVGTGAVLAQRHAVTTLAVAASITLLATFGATQVSTTFSQDDFVPEDSAMGQLLATMHQLFGGDLDETTHVLLDGDLASADAANALLETHANLHDTDHVRATAGTVDADSPVTVLTALAADARRTDQFASRGLADGVVAPDADMAALYDLAEEIAPAQLAGVLTEDRSTGLIAIATTAGQDDAAALRDQLHADLAPLAAVGIEVTVVSDGLLFNDALGALTDSQTRAIVITLLAALLVLTIFYTIRLRRPLLGIIAMVPSTLVVAWVLGTMSVLGISFNVMTAMVASLAIGIGVPYGIHVTNRFTEDLANSDDVDDAIANTLAHTGTALVGSAATTAAGFGVLAFASLVPMQQFGLITALTIVYSLIGAVLVQPACLKLWASRQQQRDTDHLDAAHLSPTRRGPERLRTQGPRREARLRFGATLSHADERREELGDGAVANHGHRDDVGRRRLDG